MRAMPADELRHPILRYLRDIRATSRNSGISDADLLRRFAACRDEAAFELLVWRHGAMVLRVCRGVLGDAAAAEDVFQAAFFALSRKAASVAGVAAPAGWLYRVATRIALKVRAASLSRTNREARQIPRPGPPPPDVLAESGELAAIVHEEVDRLATCYRLPLVLCYFEGLTHQDAARELGWPKGTVAGRLARARELLKRRLVRRGVALSAAGLAGLFSPTADAAMTASVATIMARAAADFAAGNPTSVAPSATAFRLANGEIHAMLLTKLKAISLLCLTVCLVAIATGALVRANGTKAAPPEASVAAQAGAAAPDPDPEQKENKVSVMNARERLQSLKNLKQIALALHNYHSVYNHFPTDFTDAQGQPTLSWRVALLPYLESGDVYARLKLDEPWDSANNKRQLQFMPQCFRAPTQAVDATDTFYQGFAGPGAMFERPLPVAGSAAGTDKPSVAPGGASRAGVASAIAGAAPATPGTLSRPIRLTDVTDGSSNTLGVVEAVTPVPWTKPQDIPYEPNKPLPKIGGVFPHVINVAFMDGSVYSLRRDFKDRLLRAAITRNGREMFNPDELKEPPLRIRAREAEGINPDSTWPGITSPKDVNLLLIDNRTLQQVLDKNRVEIAKALSERDDLRDRAFFRDNIRDNPEGDAQKLAEHNIALAKTLQEQQAELEKIRQEIARLRQAEKK